jgi:BlaI family transcriptional regulator, penicillinase repressor
VFPVLYCYKSSHVTENNSVSPLPPLGDLEHELLSILWAGGEMTAVEVRKKVARKLKDATIRTVLRRLEEKGYVTHTVDGGTFVYRPAESADSAAADAVKGILDRFCGGSIERALQALVDAALIEPKQLAVIAGRLKRRTR